MPRQVRGAFDALDRLCTTDQTAALEKWNTNVENSNWMTYPTPGSAPWSHALCGRTPSAKPGEAGFPLCTPPAKPGEAGFPLCTPSAKPGSLNATLRAIPSAAAPHRTPPPPRGPRLHASMSMRMTPCRAFAQPRAHRPCDVGPLPACACASSVCAGLVASGRGCGALACVRWLAA